MKELFVLLLILLGAKALAQTQENSTKKLQILTLGDSNGTFAYSWPQQLKDALPDAQVFNISKSGRTIGFINNGDSTLNSLLVLNENLKKAAEFSSHYDFIILILGTNDAKSVFRDHQQEVAPNLKALIHSIKTCPYAGIRQSKLIIVSPPPYGSKAEITEKYAGGNARVKAMSQTFVRIVHLQNGWFVNGFITPGLDIETMSSDGIHLNAEGSRMLIRPIFSLLNPEKY